MRPSRIKIEQNLARKSVMKILASRPRRNDILDVACSLSECGRGCGHYPIRLAVGHQQEWARFATKKNTPQNSNELGFSMWYTFDIELKKRLSKFDEVTRYFKIIKKQQISKLKEIKGF